MTPTEPMFLQIGLRRYEGPYKQASAMYCEARDQSGFGASEMPSVKIVNEAGKTIATISYNGRVWQDKTMICEGQNITEHCAQWIASDIVKA